MTIDNQHSARRYGRQPKKHVTIVAIRKANPRLSFQEIGEAVGVSKTTVGTVLKKAGIDTSPGSKRRTAIVVIQTHPELTTHRQIAQTAGVSPMTVGRAFRAAGIDGGKPGRRPTIDPAPILKAVQKHPDWTYAEIAKEVGGISTMTVGRVIKRASLKTTDNSPQPERSEYAPQPAQPLPEYII